MALETLKTIERVLESSVSEWCPRNWERPHFYNHRLQRRRKGSALPVSWG